MDGYAATHTAIRELKETAILPINVCVRTSEYLNNLIEQYHRRVKQRVYPMLGFKRFANVAVTISGVELAHKIRKGQFDTSDLARFAPQPSSDKAKFVRDYYERLERFSLSEEEVINLAKGLGARDEKLKSAHI